ncbi:hypothetical protein J6590_009450 [Homalodisca vitripennis]|nr:hypothetical protein J6590_009450 [Homalodisca vitripennis]
MGLIRYFYEGVLRPSGTLVRSHQPFPSKMESARAILYLRRQRGWASGSNPKMGDSSCHQGQLQSSFTVLQVLEDGHHLGVPTGMRADQPLVATNVGLKEEATKRWKLGQR